MFLTLEEKIWLFGKSAWVCGGFLLVVCCGWFFNYYLTCNFLHSNVSNIFMNTTEAEFSNISSFL